MQTISYNRLNSILDNLLKHYNSKKPIYTNETLNLFISDIRYMQEQGYDLYNKEWLGIGISDSCCAVAVPLNNKLQRVLKLIN